MFSRCTTLNERTKQSNGGFSPTKLILIDEKWKEKWVDHAGRSRLLYGVYLSFIKSRRAPHRREHHFAHFASCACPPFVYVLFFHLDERETYYIRYRSVGLIFVIAQRADSFSDAPESSTYTQLFIVVLLSF